jgi:hypothetical protein
MKNARIMFATVASLLLCSVGTPCLADDGDTTVTGEAKCAKCALKEADKCQTVIETEKDGKKVSYYLVDNAVAKGFHKTICQEPKKVTAIGKVKEVDGKQQLTASKIEVAEK